MCSSASGAQREREREREGVLDENIGSKGIILFLSSGIVHGASKSA